MSDLHIRPIEQLDLITWTKIFNSKSTLVPFRQRITPHLLQKTCERASLSLDTMLIAEDSDRPIAVARLTSMGKGHSAILSDITVKRTDNEHEFIEGLLDYARSIQASRVVSWVSGDSLLLSDLLGDFTFEPMSVHLIMEDVMLLKPESTDFEYRSSSEESSPEYFIPYHTNRAHGISLNELAEHLERAWYPLCKTEHPSIRAYASRKQPHQGWLDLSSSPVQFVDSLSDVIQEGLYQMYTSGIRDVTTEVAAGTDYKRGLLDLGFGVKTSLFELCLDLVY
ncbi:MAG: hypothetical protein RTU30_03105 [Candidatus Thorarchaeota archaeon]